MTDEHQPQDVTTGEAASSDAPDASASAPPPPAPGEHSTGGAKLFVIFFLAIVPLLGIALLAMVIYGLLMR